MKQIGIYSRPLKKNSLYILERIISLFSQCGVEVYLFRFICKDPQLVFAGFKNLKCFASFNDMPPDLDMMISLGGDGTFLETVTYVRDTDIPILGINTGRLGFLADIALEDLEKSIEMIINRRYQTEERSLIQVESSENLGCEFLFGLNDFTLRKSDKATLIKIHTWLDGEFLNSYWADGLIVSTPTGSTAYSLSVGGPIVVPESNNFIISPIASHNLTVRPLVVSADHKITMKVEGANMKHMASIDARSYFFKSKTIFTISKAAFSVKVVKLEGHTFYNTIRNKLMWGIDKRN